MVYYIFFLNLVDNVKPHDNCEDYYSTNITWVNQLKVTFYDWRNGEMLND